MPDMISDGKRMRLVWNPSDGDGDPSRHVIERTKTTLKGHPTWKLFTTEISLPIIRGSKDEPPHYVYLDDQACYTIWCTQVYSHEELKTFWPYDFDHQGNVSSGRKNRGRPAFMDEAGTTYAQVPLRRRKRMYRFSGEIEITEYVPVRPKRQSNMEKLVATEFAAEAKQQVIPIGETESVDKTPTSPTLRKPTTGSVLNQVLNEAPPSPTVLAPVSKGPSPVSVSLTHNRGPDFFHSSLGANTKGIVRPNSITPQKARVKPLNLSTRLIPDAEYNEVQVSDHSNTKRSLSQAFPSKKKEAGGQEITKRTMIQPFILSSSDSSPATPSPKRVDRPPASTKSFIQPFLVSSTESSPTTPSPRCVISSPVAPSSGRAYSNIQKTEFGCDGADDDPEDHHVANIIYSNDNNTKKSRANNYGARLNGVMEASECERQHQLELRRLRSEVESMKDDNKV